MALKLLDEVRKPDYSSPVFRAGLLLLFTLLSCATPLAASEPVSNFILRFQALIDNKEARNALGYGTDFFRDPYQNFGHLSDEIMRTVRLVVDTGLHSMNWTRD